MTALTHGKTLIGDMTPSHREQQMLRTPVHGRNKRSKKSWRLNKKDCCTYCTRTQGPLDRRSPFLPVGRSSPDVDTSAVHILARRL